VHIFEEFGEIYGAAAAALATVALVILLWGETRRGLALMHASYRPDTLMLRLGILGRVFALALRAVWSRIAGDVVDMFKTVQLRIEHDICSGYYYGPDRRLRAVWSKESRERLWLKEQEEVPGQFLTNCNAFRDEGFQEGIDRYFAALGSLKRAPEFVSAVEVQTGFVAPLLLLAGVLQYFGEDWEPVIAKFGRDTEELGDPLAASGSHRLRKLQAFIFDCWLLWGPSIPICNDKCDEWGRGSLSSLQCGYGDENNSIELIADKKELQEVAANFTQRSVMAFKACVRGTLKRGSNIQSATGQFLVRPLADAMQTEDRRLVLDLRKDGKVTAIEGAEDSGTPYYSAYLWVLIVVLGADGRPIHEAADAPRRFPWASFVPFFEHGNIADRDTCLFLKQQLADKAIGAIVRVVAELSKSNRHVRFAYACAIDDSGCGNGLAYPSDSSSIKAMMQAAAPKPLLDSGVLDFQTYTPDDHPFSACKLPGILKRYYEELDKEAKP
jgi:hypothetical protein